MPRTSTRRNPIRRSTRSDDGPVRRRRAPRSRRYSAGTSGDHGRHAGIARREPHLPMSAPDDRLALAPAQRSSSGPPSRRRRRGSAGRGSPRRGGPGTTQSPGPSAAEGAGDVGARGVREPVDRRPRPASPASGASPQSTPDLAARASRSARSSSRPASTTTSARYVGPVAYRNTERVMPPCHHWSWSSTNDRVGPLHDRQPQLVARPARTSARDVELGGQVRVLADRRPSAPLSSTSSTLSAAPTCSTTRRPAQPPGTSNVRS